MQTVLVEIEEHQAARKQQVENATPPERRGEQPLRVQQHQLVGVGTKQGNVGLAKGMAADDKPMTLHHPLDESLRIRKYLEGIADDRPAIVAWDVAERFAGRRPHFLAMHAAKSEGLQRHGFLPFAAAFPISVLHEPRQGSRLPYEVSISIGKSRAEI